MPDPGADAKAWDGAGAAGVEAGSAGADAGRAPATAPGERSRVRAVEQRFEGRIAGFGTASGVRLVLGLWERSPLGRFADVMMEDAAGQRTLFAPTPEVADFVAGTYSFDAVEVCPVQWRREPHGLILSVGGQAANADGTGSGERLRVRLRVGEVPPLGRLLRAVPPRVATDPRWLRAIDPVAALLVPGVHTAGTAGRGRREFYGVTTMRRIAWAEASLDGRDLGAFAQLDPPVRFGFGSAPPEPQLVDLVTTIRPA